MTTLTDSERHRVNEIIERFDPEYAGVFLEYFSLDALHPVEMKLLNQDYLAFTKYYEAVEKAMIGALTGKGDVQLFLADAPTRAVALAKVIEEMK